MPNDEKSKAPGADVILRVLGPPKHDLRAHKLILSLASPIFRDIFSLPQPTTPTSEDSHTIDVVEVTDKPHALRIILKMIYPHPSPPLNGDLDTLVDCLVVAEKYEIEGALSQLRDALSQVDSPLRIYAIATRFGFTDLAESASHDILSLVNLAGVTQLPDDFEFITAIAYHKLIRQRARYLEAVVDIVKLTPLRSVCFSCRGGPYTEEVFRWRLAHIITRGTPVGVAACLGAWVKLHGLNSECEAECVAKFIRASVARVIQLLDNPGAEAPTRKKSILKKT